MAWRVLSRTSRLALAVFQRDLKKAECRARSTTTAPVKIKFLDFLQKNFRDTQPFTRFENLLQRWRTKSMNSFYLEAKMRYGPDTSSALFILTCGGGVRLKEQTEWFRSDGNRMHSWDFLNYVGVPIEEVDLSTTAVNFSSFEQIGELQNVKVMSLRDCPHVDDWCLTRLHAYRHSLEDLCLTGCSLVTERGLPALCHLRKLRRLDITGLPLIINKSLIKVLMEDALPDTTVIIEDCA
uniref:distal membrane-arm assembly complex protein 2 n=1 Tax=Myxine glutinosa TaxID=7769 RepID=UPI00358EDC13